MGANHADVTEQHFLSEISRVYDKAHDKYIILLPIGIKRLLWDVFLEEKFDDLFIYFYIAKAILERCQAAQKSVISSFVK